DSREDHEYYCTHEHVVEMGDQKVGIVELPVPRGGGQHDSRQSRNQKLKEERNTKEHWCRKAQLSTPYRSEPVEDFDARRNANHHCGNHKKCVSGRGHPDCEHVM